MRRTRRAAVTLSRLRRDERGIALVVVLLVTSVLLAVVTTSLTVVVDSQKHSRHDQDWNAALAAAQAGVDDYLYRVENDSGTTAYYQYSYSNPPPAGTNPAFTGWANVAGSPDAQYHYAVDDYIDNPNPLTGKADGTIVVRSTGRVRNTVRRVQVTTRRKSFLDFLYFSNYETTDPNIGNLLYNDGSASDRSRYGNYANLAQASADCQLYDYGSPRRASYCDDIYFATGDVIGGQLQSNDAIHIFGSPQFNGSVYTGFPGWACGGRTVLWHGSDGSQDGGCGDTPSFTPGYPKTTAVLTFPTDNALLKQQTNRTLGGTGCLYSGPTQITLHGSLMDVSSPFSPLLPAPPAVNCGTGLNLALPPNGVVYIQAAPAGSTCPIPGQNRVGYPMVGDINKYGCTDADLFVSGNLAGRLTLSADNNIVVTGNLTYQNGTTGTDILGLRAGSNVEVYHPVSVSGTNLDDLRQANSPFNNPQIFAAILALKHSFWNQIHTQGAALGNLSVTGSIAQNFRGAVGIIGSSGYHKLYAYDPRLQYDSPPHFFDEKEAAFGIKSFGELTPSSCWSGTTWTCEG